MIVQSFFFFHPVFFCFMHSIGILNGALGSVCLFMRVYDGSIHIVFGYCLAVFFVYYEGM